LDGFRRCGDAVNAEMVKRRLEALDALSSAAA
jgi:hypothetical protein